MATSITSTNPFFKTLSFYKPLNSNLIIYPTPLFCQKHIKQSVQIPAIPRSLFVSRVAQTSEWDTQEDTQAASEDEDEDEDKGEEGFGVPPEEAKLFVGNLPFDVDSEKLANIFDAAGVVEIAEVIYNRETDRSRGFGFVTMSTVAEADKAVELLNGYDVNGRLLTVNKAAPRGSRPERTPREFGPSFRIYVGNLPWEVDNSRLEQLFSDHGNVVSCRLITDRETGRSLGFGFVAMASEAEMNAAIAALDGQTVEGRAIRVNVAVERPRR